MRRTSAALILTRVDVRSALPVGLIVAASLFGVCCMKAGTGDVAVNSNSNSNPANSSSSSNTANSSSSYDSGKYKELLDKGSEIEKLSLPVKLDPKAAIKGKVFFVENSPARARNADYDQGISDYRKAGNLEELETVVRITCAKGKFLGDYFREVSGTKQSVKAYGIDCQVSLIDYLARAVVAQKTFSNNESGEAILERSVAGEQINPPPVGDMTSYINSFSVDKVLPTMARLDEKELVRLPTTINLKPDAAVRGKIKIVQKYEKGDLGSNLYSFIEGADYFGLPRERFADKPEELETLVKIVCVKGSPIGRVEKTAQYSSKCEVSLIDYKTLSVFAQKTIENKTLDESPPAQSSTSKNWVVGPPKQEIESYLKSFPPS